jgi:hypothetical protein
MRVLIKHPNPNTNIMPDDNRVSATITAEVKTQVITKIQEIMDLLPFLVNLSPEEKQGIATIGTERGAMDAAFTSEMAAHPDLVPGFVDATELGLDRELRGALQEILQRTRELNDALEDTVHVAGSDVLLAYLSFYGNVQQASKRGVTGANTLLENLGRFFPRGKRAAASPLPQVS